MNINGLVIYRNLEYRKLFEDMACLMGLAEKEERPDAFACVGGLVELAAKYGFEGNLWHCFLAFCRVFSCWAAALGASAAVTAFTSTSCASSMARLSCRSLASRSV